MRYQKYTGLKSASLHSFIPPSRQLVAIERHDARSADMLLARDPLRADMIERHEIEAGYQQAVVRPYGCGEIFHGHGPQDTADKRIDILICDAGEIRTTLLVARLRSPVGDLLD